MIRGFAAILGAAALSLAAASCSTAPGGVALPKLRPGASPPGEAATMRGTLVRSGACLALEGGGSGTTVVIWPRGATARVAGNGTTVVIWPFRRGDPPIRTGEEAELTGIVVVTDNISGYARLPDDPGCRADRYLVVREASPAASEIALLPQLKRGANPPGESATLRGTLVRSGACVALRDGNGTTIVVWPRTATARLDGPGTVVVVWPFRRADPPIRTGEEAELAGIIVTIDNITGYARLPDDPGCRTGRYLILREARPLG